MFVLWTASDSYGRGLERWFRGFRCQPILWRSQGFWVLLFIVNYFR